MTGKSPRELAVRLMTEVDKSGKAAYTPGEVKAILNTIKDGPEFDYADPDGTCRGPMQMARLERGDVFIANYFGGKPRPWIVLRVDRDVVTAAAMSSGEKVPNMIPSQCRFWPGSWIGPSLTQFNLEVAGRQVTRPYTNLDHLRAIELHIAEALKVELLRGEIAASSVIDQVAAQ